MLAAVGCGPTPAAQGGPAAPEDPAFPPRPRQIDIRSVDPCSTLTPDRSRELGIVSSTRDDLSPGLPGCLHIASGGSYRVQILPVTGARALLPGHPDQQGLGVFRDPVRTDIDGFGAVEARLRRGAPADCAYTVDTGPDSSVQFYYSTLDGGARSPADVKAGCDRAREFASSGLRTLSGR